MLGAHRSPVTLLTFLKSVARKSGGEASDRGKITVGQPAIVKSLVVALSESTMSRKSPFVMMFNIGELKRMSWLTQPHWSGLIESLVKCLSLITLHEQRIIPFYNKRRTVFRDIFCNRVQRCHTVLEYSPKYRLILILRKGSSQYHIKYNVS